MPFFGLKLKITLKMTERHIPEKQGQASDHKTRKEDQLLLVSSTISKTTPPHTPRHSKSLLRIQVTCFSKDPAVHSHSLSLKEANVKHLQTEPHLTCTATWLGPEGITDPQRISLYTGAKAVLLTRVA